MCALSEVFGICHKIISDSGVTISKNDALNTFYLWLYGIGHRVNDDSDSERGCSFQLAARVLLYALSHRQNSTYHSLCYTSRGALAGMRKLARCIVKKTFKLKIIMCWCFE